MAELETGYVGAPGMEGANNGAHHGLVEKGREKVSEAGGAARRKVMENLDARKASLVSNLERLAGDLEKMGDGPQKQLASRAAQYVRQAEGLLNERSSDELVSMAIEEIRGRPAAMIAGAFVLGFLGARLIKS